MKVAVLWSSPNTDGLTASAKNQIISGLKKANVDILPALEKAGEVYADKLENGFNMYY